MGTKYLNSKVPVEHLLLSFLGNSLLSELISLAIQILVLEHVQKQEKHSSCLRVMYQLFFQISAGDLSTNPVTLNGLAALSLCSASNLGKGGTPALVNALPLLLFNDPTCIELTMVITPLLSEICWHRHSCSDVVFLRLRYFFLALKIRQKS